MSLTIGDTAPDFEADTTEGRISFHDWIGDSWAVLFSHPRDFTPVCTTELGYMARIKSEFDDRNTKIIAISGGGRIGNTDFLQIARKMGAVDALPKPFDPDDLLGRIDNCLKAA